MKILIYSGSFSPFHNSHLKILKEANKEFNFDKIILILSDVPVNKVLKGYVDVKHRLNMINLALSSTNLNYEVHIESNNTSKPVYSYETLLELKKKYSLDDLYFLIGSDQLNKFEHWYNALEISKMVQLIYYRRKYYKPNELNVKKFNMINVNETKIDNISSTNIRNLKTLDVDIKVRNYIADNKLYYASRIFNLIQDEARYKHSISVGSLSSSIARLNGLNEHKAYIGGILHDIGKNVSLNDSKRLIDEYYPSFSDMPSYSYHQFMGEYLAFKVFNIRDKDILDAIKFHCSGNTNMNVYAKIIYSADKIDPLRGYDSKYMIERCYLNIEEGFKFTLQENMDFIDKTGLAYRNNRLTINCYDYYFKERK